MRWDAKKRMGFNIDEHHISDSSHFNDLVLCQLLLDYTIYGRDWKLNIWTFTYAILAYLNVSTAWACTAYLKISLLSKRVCIKFRLKKKYFSPQLRQNKPYYKKIQYNSCLFMQKVWKKGKKWAQTIRLHTSQKGGKNGSVPKKILHPWGWRAGRWRRDTQSLLLACGRLMKSCEAPLVVFLWLFCPGGHPREPTSLLRGARTRTQKERKPN